MDAEKVKEIVFSTISNCVESLHCKRGAGMNDPYVSAINWIESLKDDITQIFHNAEAADQESYKDLPLCNEERGALIADRIDPCTWYEPRFCVYHKQDSELIVSRCACLTEEPTENSEPKDKTTPTLLSLMEYICKIEGRVQKQGYKRIALEERVAQLERNIGVKGEA